MSTPDIKNLGKQESSSPYVSLHRDNNDPQDDSDSDLDSSCDDDSEEEATVTIDQTEIGGFTKR